MRFVVLGLSLWSGACSETGISGRDGKNRGGTTDASAADDGPVTGSVRLRPDAPKTNDVAIAELDMADALYDEDDVSYAFEVDGETVQHSTDALLRGIDHFDKGQSVQVFAIVDNGPYTTTLESNTVTVANTPPTAPMARIDADHACPDGWTEMTDGDRCVRVFVDGTSTWQQAQAQCREMGGDLARIGNAAENELVTSMAAAAGMPGEHFWIGYNDLATEGTWSWIDGGPVTYENWRPGEPSTSDDGYSNCGTIYFIASMWGLWNDFWCDPPYGQGGFACQVDTEESNLTCIIEEPSNDDDMDPIDYRFSWDVDGTPFTEALTTDHPGDTIPGESVSDRRLWTCTVTPNDGEEDGPPATAQYGEEGCPDAWFETDFNGATPTELAYNGEAYHDSAAGNVRIAGAGIAYDNNIVYLKDAIPSDQFYVSVETNMAGEGDGVAIIISNDDDFTAHRPDQPYGVGGPTGYIVIFDTWSNAVDPKPGDFVAVYDLNEVWPHDILVYNTAIPTLDDGVDHTFEITVDAGRMLVDIDGVNHLDYDLPTLLDPEVMIGWGAHNGVKTGTKTIDNIVVACTAPDGA